MRSAEKEQRRLHAPIVDRQSEEPPPFVVLVHGPPGVGKSTLIRSLIKHYTRQTVGEIRGPITVVSGKTRRLTLVECPNDVRGRAFWRADWGGAGRGGRGEWEGGGGRHAPRPRGPRGGALCVPAPLFWTPLSSIHLGRQGRSLVSRLRRGDCVVHDALCVYLLPRVALES